MRYLNLLLVLLLFSCNTNKDMLDIDQIVKIWEIKSYIQNDEEYMNTSFKEAYLSFNTETKKLYITYDLSEDSITQLQELWGKNIRKLELTSVEILQELVYTQRRENKIINQIFIKKAEVDYFIKGNRIDLITQKINDTVFTNRAGESSGVFGLLINKLVPTVVDQIPFPELKVNDQFDVEFTNNEVHLNNENTKIVFDYMGTHRWLGF